MSMRIITVLLATGFLVGSLGSCSKAPKSKSKTKSGSAEVMDYSLPPDDQTARNPRNRRDRRPMKRPPRRQRPAGPEMAGSHILLAYKGARRARPNVTRTKEEALKLAKKLSAQLKKNPKQFEALAKKHSDGPTGKRGGFLGSWRQGRMVPEFDKAISKMKVGQISEPVETPFGYHVMKRMPLPPTYAGRHILIAYKGAKRARPNVTRTKEEALKLAKKLSAQLQKDPKKFVEMAKKHSNGPSASKGGSLGKWKKGRMVPEFDTAIQKLKIGKVSGPVETPFGYHVIKREDPKTMPDTRPRMPSRRMPRPRRR